MALDLTRMQILAKPVSSYYEGRALRNAEAMAQKQGELLDANIERAKLEAEILKTPPPVDQEKKLQTAKAALTLMRDFEAQTLAGYQSKIDSGVPEEEARSWAQQDFISKRQIAKGLGLYEIVGAEPRDDAELQWDKDAAVGAITTADELLNQISPDEPQKEKKTAAIAEYEYARDQGYKGTFRQFISEQQKSAAPRPPVGFEWDPEAPGQLRPITGGPKDPNTPSQMGAREAVFFNRVMSGAFQAVQTLDNIVNLPVGSSTGLFGVGGSPGTSLTASAKGVLTNKIAPQSVQDYNTMLVGIERNLASIETAGLVPSDTFTGSFGTLQLREGDTEYTKLRKLAEMAQTIEEGLQPSLVNPRVPEVQKQALQELIKRTRVVIPFTHNDITALQRAQEKNPEMTLQQLMEQKGLQTSGDLEVGTVQDGYRFKGGDPSKPESWEKL